MPKKAKELEAIHLRKLNKPGFHAVGGVAGLLLKVSPSGAKSWVLRYATGEMKTSATGKPFVGRQDLGLGGYPDVTLSGAREAAREAKAKIRQGINPVDERRQNRASMKRDNETRITFKTAWPAFWADKAAELGEKTQAHWENSIEAYALPVIGNMVVREIATQHIEKVLRPIWEKKAMTAKKLRGRLEAILSWATVKGYRSGDNPARWGDNLKEILPKISKVHKTTHFRAMLLHETPDFVKALRERDGTAARALEFLILTACRSGEVRGARWDEIDLKKGIWVIPAERMKMDQAHSIPLPEAALALLEQMPSDGDLIFPAPRGGQLSDMSLLAVLKRMGAYEKTTVHGFRSSFKDWAYEETEFPHFISEMALAHSVGDDVQKAYRRSELLGKRLAMMRQWAAFLGYSETSQKVITLDRARA